MPALLPRSPPPPHYYADNLLRLLRAVESQYSDLLSASERDYVRRVSALSIEAQRLYARLLTRKGPLVRIDSLRYREIADVDAALAELADAMLVRRDPVVPADQVLELLTRAELRALFPHATARRRCKGDDVVAVAARYPDHRIRTVVAERHCACTVLELDVLATMQILFFGDARNELTTFVLEDLGMLRYERYALDSVHRPFRDRAALDDYLTMQSLRTVVHSLGRHWRASAARAVIETLWDPRDSRALERLRSGLLNQLGRCAERARDFDAALDAYGRSVRAPARERVARVLRRLDDEPAVQRVLDRIERAPVSAGERFFASQFRARRRVGTERIPEQILRLPGPPSGRVETAVLAALTNGCAKGRHLENRSPLGMLGLAFWDIVFAPVEAAFVNAYQDRPLDLYWEDFRRARAESIDARLRELTAPGALERRALRTAAAKRGVTNALVDWSSFDAEWIRSAVRAVPGAAWVAMFDHMLDDLEQSRTGFPDLTLFFGASRGAEGYRFVEVKGPGDQLRREQRLWFSFFARHGIAASVLRVEW